MSRIILPSHYLRAAPRPGPQLVAGPITGWRLWRLRHDGILLSISMSCEWPIGVPLIGEPESGNEKGIYAAKTRSGLADLGYASRDYVIGTVALWGKVIEHEKGFRAQYAYPLTVDLSRPSPMPGFPISPRRSAIAKSIRDNYGCEVLE